MYMIKKPCQNKIQNFLNQFYEQNGLSYLKQFRKKYKTYAIWERHLIIIKLLIIMSHVHRK